MSIAAFISGEVGPGVTIPYLVTRGLGIGEAVEAEETKPDGAGGHKHDERRHVLVEPIPAGIAARIERERQETESEPEEKPELPKRPKLKLRRDTIETMPFVPTALDENLITELQKAQALYMRRAEEELLLWMVIE